MAIIKCEKGHFYDDTKYKNCPHCENGLHRVRRETHNDDLDNMPTQGIPYNSTHEQGNKNPTISLEMSLDSSKEGITIGAYSFCNGTQLPVGWLVEVKGYTKGKDYKLFEGWNRIGRSKSMGVYIPGDKKISAQNHGAIVFDEKNTKYHFINETGSLSYVNNENVCNTIELESGDLIRLGDTELIFIAFCTRERKWENFLEL